MSPTEPVQLTESARSKRFADWWVGTGVSSVVWMFAYIGMMWFLRTPDAAPVTIRGINLGAVVCGGIGLSTMILDIVARRARNRRA